MISVEQWAETVQPEWRCARKPVRWVYVTTLGEDRRTHMRNTDRTIRSWFDGPHYRAVVKAKAIERYKATLHERLAAVTTTLLRGMKKQAPPPRIISGPLNPWKRHDAT